MGWLFLPVNVIAAPYENYTDITLPNENTKQRTNIYIYIDIYKIGNVIMLGGILR